MPSEQPASGRYHEVLWPHWWFWLLPTTFAAALGIAYGYAYGAGAGWLVGLATAALLLIWLGLAVPTRLEVGPNVFRAGRAALPLEFIGRVRALDAQQAFRARTTSADPRAWLVLRTWASATAVMVEVIDQEDPHPYWLVSTRRPVELAAALQAARDECSGLGANPAPTNNPQAGSASGAPPSGPAAGPEPTRGARHSPEATQPGAERLD